MWVTLTMVLWLLSSTQATEAPREALELNAEAATALAQLPLECHKQEFPHKTGLVFNSSADVVSPRVSHPVFYGCFDWHSSVHGHWLLATVMNQFPDTVIAEKVAKLFDQQFTEEKMQEELATFSKKYQKLFERTYGWAWYLKLHQALLDSPLDEEKGWSSRTKFLADKIVSNYKAYLPSLAYPIRVGTHSNTAFGLIFALDYAIRVNDTELSDVINTSARNHFLSDKNCPLLGWEPSGSDFLSPCLQEADLMSRILKDDDESSYLEWLKAFLPEIFMDNFALEPGKVLDGTDGYLVHLDGVNFSRAWNLYNIAARLPQEHVQTRNRLRAVADAHVLASRDEVIGSHYSGSHWLASFLLHALEKRQESS